MDEEKRELNFPTEDSDDTKSSAKSPEDAKINMQQSLQRIASGMAQSFAAAHEVVKLVSPAILNFAKMTQEISIAMIDRVVFQCAFAVGNSDYYRRTQARSDFKSQKVGRVRMDTSSKRSD